MRAKSHLGKQPSEKASGEIWRSATSQSFCLVSCIQRRCEAMPDRQNAASKQPRNNYKTARTFANVGAISLAWGKATERVRSLWEPVSLSEGCFLARVYKNLLSVTGWPSTDTQKGDCAVCILPSGGVKGIFKAKDLTATEPWAMSKLHLGWPLRAGALGQRRVNSYPVRGSLSLTQALIDKMILETSVWRGKVRIRVSQLISGRIDVCIQYYYKYFYTITYKGYNLLFRSNYFNISVVFLPVSEQITACSLIWVMIYLK